MLDNGGYCCSDLFKNGRGDPTHFLYKSLAVGTTNLQRVGRRGLGEAIEGIRLNADVPKILSERLVPIRHRHDELHWQLSYRVRADDHCWPGFLDFRANSRIKVDAPDFATARACGIGTQKKSFQSEVLS